MDTLKLAAQKIINLYLINPKQYFKIKFKGKPSMFSFINTTYHPNKHPQAIFIEKNRLTCHSRVISIKKIIKINLKSLIAWEHLLGQGCFIGIIWYVVLKLNRVFTYSLC